MCAIACALGLGTGSVWAQLPDKPPAIQAPTRSALDAPLFYQLLIGEIELTAGRSGSAYEVLLDAARRSGDDALFQRAVDVALQSRAGDQALAATRAWRKDRPDSIDARRYQIQILVASNRLEEAGEPLTSWIAALPADQRSALIAAIPRLLQRASDRKQAASLMEQWLAPYREGGDTRTAVHVALGRAWLAASEAPKALDLAQRAVADDPGAPGPVLLALDLIALQPKAEVIVTQYLARERPEIAIRLAYVRTLTLAQRYTEASRQLERLTKDQPTLPAPWLTLGALRMDMRQLREAEAALQRYVELTPRQPAAAAPETEDDNDSEGGDERGLTQAWLLLAQVAEQRGDLKGAEGWLAKIDNPTRALEVQSRRASLLARQGKFKEAREMVRRVPERNVEDARAKLLAEAQVMRDVKRWRDAAEVLSAANRRFADDVDLIYEQAMIEDKLERYGEMERLLRRVIQLKPDHPHAHNALGYSLADRRQQLPEAKELIEKALSLSPGDPFIIDSLGWVEFRLGNREDALRLLRQAYASRPDIEIAAHLGEVLWAMGRREEARQVWQDARGRDATNEVLRETLARLKVSL